MAHLSITPSAAEQIQRALAERGHGLGLRVSVKPSGCSGYSYVLDFADQAANDDAVFEEHGIERRLTRVKAYEPPRQRTPASTTRT